MLEPQPVEFRRTLVLGDADRDHFGQPTLMLRAEIRMRLDLVHHNDPVGLRCQTVAVKMRPVVQSSIFDHVHAASDRRTDAFLRQAVCSQNVRLPLRRSAAVAAHSRHEKRLAPQRLRYAHTVR